MSARLLPIAAAMLGAGCATTGSAPPPADARSSQAAWARACAGQDGWDTPGPPFRVHGESWYVGTCGITALLVRHGGRLTLIDSGTDRGAEVVLANIRALGFDPRDVATILMSHEHFDHVGGLARVQAATGATIVATKEAAAVLRSGRPAADDPQAASGHPPFPPVTGRINILTDARRRMLVRAGFTALATPGHTPGALSWSWRSCEGRGCRTIVYADSLNPISADGYRFSDHPALVAAMRAGIDRVVTADCDILLAPHPAAAALRERTAGSAPLIDRDGCRAYAARATARLDARLAAEAADG